MGRPTPIPIVRGDAPGGASPFLKKKA